MDDKLKKTLGQIASGCGCLSLLAISAWMCFVIYVGIQGRGNDEEASVVIGAVTCCATLPVVALTGAGLFFAFKKNESG